MREFWNTHKIPIIIIGIFVITVVSIVIFGVGVENINW